MLLNFVQCLSVYCDEELAKLDPFAPIAAKLKETGLTPVRLINLRPGSTVGVYRGSIGTDLIAGAEGLDGGVFFLTIEGNTYVRIIIACRGFKTKTLEQYISMTSLILHISQQEEDPLTL